MTDDRRSHQNGHDRNDQREPSIATATSVSEAKRTSRARFARRVAAKALDVLFVSEKGWPLRSTAESDRGL
jgi:hypothetical protein